MTVESCGAIWRARLEHALDVLGRLRADTGVGEGVPASSLAEAERELQRPLPDLGEVMKHRTLLLRRSSLAKLAWLASCIPVLGCAPAIDFQPRDDRYAACGRRAALATAQADHVVLAGTIYKLDDAIPVDGPVRIVLIDAEGAPRKLYFGSLFTVPAPSERRKAVYCAIAPSQPGDCVRASGTLQADGSMAIEEFENLDRGLNDLALAGAASCDRMRR